MDQYESRSEAVVTLPRMNAHDNARVPASVRAGASGQANAAQHRALLAERARLIPSFNQLRALILEDLREAYGEDRLHHTRQAKNRRASWLVLYRPFARLNGINQMLRIKALDRSGNYGCELIDKEPPDMWAQFVRLGEHYGIAEAELSALYQRAQTKKQQRV
jgi:hypothetical protein